MRDRKSRVWSRDFAFPMALFGRESAADRERAERVGAWVRARSPFSLVSVMFGLMGVLDCFFQVVPVVLGVAAIIAAALGLRQIRIRPQLLGKRLSAAGITLGALALVLSAVVWTVFY